jgi:nucleoside-diphosphate kinase
MNHEITLILVKPDAVAEGLTGQVLARLEKEKMKILNCRMLRLDGPLLKEHYSHIAHLPFFPEIEKFMSSGPVIAVALQGPKAIERVRELLGPTDSTKAPKGTIRGDWGKDKMHNVLHASDSTETAKAELRRFFGSENPVVGG